MEPLDITPVGESLHVSGYPDAVRLIEVDDSPRARRLRHLALHRHDLGVAAEFTEVLRSQRSAELTLVERTALWHAALVHFCKCFDTAEDRVRLEYSKIYPSGVIREVYEHYTALRDRHLVHDANDYAQAKLGVVLGPEGQVQDLLVMAMVADTLSAEGVENLDGLIRLALDFVAAQMEEIRRHLVISLEQLSSEELLTRPKLTYRAPGPGEI